MEENDKKEGRKPNPINASFGVSGFPIKQYNEWRRDCQINFNDCFWQKMYADHLKAKQLELLSENVALKVVQEEEVEEEVVEDPNDEKRLCFGGGIEK